MTYTVNYYYNSDKSPDRDYSNQSGSLIDFFTGVARVIQSVFARIIPISFFNRKANKKDIYVIKELQKDFPSINVELIKKVFNEFSHVKNLNSDQKIMQMRIKIEKYINDVINNLGGNLEKDPNAIEANHKIKKYILNETIKNGYTFFNLSEIILKYRETYPECKYIIRFLSRIHENSKNEPVWVRSALDTCAKSLIQISRSELIGKPSSNARDTLRTPMEIIIDLLVYLEHPSLGMYQEIKDQAKSLILSHTISIENVKELLDTIQISFSNSELADKCRILSSQLMKEPVFTRFNDNIYGRVFDSSFVIELINTPPKEVLKAMTLMSQGLANHLKNVSNTIDHETYNMIEKKIGSLLKNKDPRFWFPAIDELKNLQEDEKIDKLQGLIAYLDAPKITGHECISIPYLMVKISLILREQGISPPWLPEADRSYGKYLHPYVNCIRILNRQNERKTCGVGITLRHQPPIGYQEWMVPSERPTTVRKPNLDLKEAIPTAKEALKVQLEHEIPWASGMSGSTNISLYAWDYFNRTYGTIDSKATLLGIIMFLVYDGGHSIHESLWAANEINSLLPLGFKLNNGTCNFIFDYGIFTNMYKETLKQNIRDAFEKAFDKVIRYYKTHSFYNKSRESIP